MDKPTESAKDASASVPAPAALTPAQLAAIERARLRALPLQRGVRVATIDAWLSAVLAGLTVLSACGGIENLVVGAALAFVAFNSFRGAQRLRRHDPAAPRQLAMNQLVFAGCVVLYGAYSLWQVSAGQSSILRFLVGDDSTALLGKEAGIDIRNIQQWVKNAMYAFYIILIGGTLIVQPLMAIYYCRRGKILQAFLAETPAWVVDILRGAPGGTAGTFQVFGSK